MTHAVALEHTACEACGDTFTRAPGEDWKRLCLTCWKASPAARKAAPDRLVQLAAELAEVRAERDRLRCRVHSLEQFAIPPDMLRRLASEATPTCPDQMSPSGLQIQKGTARPEPGLCARHYERGS